MRTAIIAAFMAAISGIAVQAQNAIPAGHTEIIVRSCTRGVDFYPSSYVIAGVRCPWLFVETRTFDQQVHDTYPGWEIIETRPGGMSGAVYTLLLKKKS